MNENEEALEAAAGHRFQERELLRRALTHKSYAYEKSAVGLPHPEDNEQLEFLGDSVLGFLVSDLLVRRYPDLAEGELSKLKAHLVSSTHLHTVAQRLQIGEHLLLGRGEDLSGGRAKKALLANALEALMAAIYLDAGLEAVRQFVVRHVISGLEGQLEGSGLPLTDFKSALQEAAQARGLPPPRYAIVGESGPDHAKTFAVEARVGADWIGQAEALTKKAAEQKAAQSLLEKMAAAT
jgi:ribonuclease III